MAEFDWRDRADALFECKKEPALGSRGMVVTNHPLASTAGMQMLAGGGNAFDAAIATAAVEAVTVSAGCGLGGEPFVIMYEAKTGRVYGLNGSGKAPMAATRDYFVNRGHKTMPLTGPLAAAIPGEVAGWEGILERFGTRTLASLLEPAIGYADEGHAVLLCSLALRLLGGGCVGYFKFHADTLFVAVCANLLSS